MKVSYYFTAVSAPQRFDSQSKLESFMMRLFLLFSFLYAYLVPVTGFATLSTARDVAFHTTVSMVSAPSENFGDESIPDGIPRRKPSSEGQRNIPVEKKQANFVSGDELHKLRHEVMAMRLELQEARCSGSKPLVRALEKAIMNAQQVDAEFVYIVSLERQELAEKKELFQEAENYNKKAMEARSALPHFNLDGLWVGKYGEHGYEMINITYDGDILIAQKVTGANNVPKGEVTFEVDLGPTVMTNNNQVLEPIKLGDSAAKQWGSKYLQRFSGRGQIAAEGFRDSQWIDGQLIMVNEYFSFAWLPIGHQVFFGRPTPELILKLLKDHERNESGECTARTFLEKCWTETQHLEDDIMVNEDFFSTDERDYYHQEGYFE
jgi:hypothetical protein